jgi:hypothetical protein
LSRILVIDVDTNGLTLASGTVRKGAPVIDRAIAQTDELPALTPELASGLGKKIKELMKQAGMSAAPAVLLVGRDRLFLKEVRHPPVPGAEEPAVVRFQAVKELSDNPEDMALDYLPLGPTPDGGRKAIAVFVRKDFLKAAKEMCEAAGLKLAAVTPRPYAAAAGLRQAIAAGVEPPDAPTDAVALVYPAGAGGEFVVIRGDDMLFSRPVPAAAFASEAAFVGETRRNLAVVGGQVPGGVTAVYLAEAESPGGGWAGRLQDALPIPVRAYDPLAGSSVGDAVPAQYRGRFAAAGGAIALKAAPGPLPINFVTPRQPKSEPNKNRTLFMVAALAACILVGLAIFGGMRLVDSASQEVASLTSQKDSIDENLKFLTLNAKRADAAEEFMKFHVRLHDEMYDWTHLFPEIVSTRVTMIDYTAAAMPSKKERQDEEKRKETNPAYKAPIKPVGKVTFTIQAKDSTQVAAFVRALSTHGNYVNVTAPQGGGLAGSGSLNQTFTVKADVLARPADKYSRTLNVTMPKPKSKLTEPDDDFGGGFGGGPGFSAPIGGGELP